MTGARILVLEQFQNQGIGSLFGNHLRRELAHALVDVPRIHEQYLVGHFSFVHGIRPRGIPLNTTGKHRGWGNFHTSQDRHRRIRGQFLGSYILGLSITVGRRCQGDERLVRLGAPGPLGQFV